MLSKLPPRESQIVDILYERGALPVADICDALPDQLSGSAVRAMLKRLEDKGFVPRSKSDRGFLYSPMVSDSVAKKSALSDIVKTSSTARRRARRAPCSGCPTGSMTDELDELEQMIANARKDKGGQLMYVLIGIALKSVLIAGLTLGLLALMRQRSAAERSWVAHIGLLALVVLALAPLVLPKLDRRGPGPARPGAAHRGRRPRLRPRRHRAVDSAKQPACRVSRRRSAGVAQPDRRDDGALCRSGGDPAAHHLPRAGPAGRPARARRGAGRRTLAERPRPRPAAHGLQARHRACSPATSSPRRSAGA